MPYRDREQQKQYQRRWVAIKRRGFDKVTYNREMSNPVEPWKRKRRPVLQTDWDLPGLLTRLTPRQQSLLEGLGVDPVQLHAGDKLVLLRRGEVVDLETGLLGEERSEEREELRRRIDALHQALEEMQWHLRAALSISEEHLVSGDEILLASDDTPASVG